MTPESQDDDRTLRLAPEASLTVGFQKTEWAAADAGTQKTLLAPPVHDPMGGNLPVGTRLGEFEILSLIGEGGFGIVYLAQDHSLQRRVALKEYMPSSLAMRVGGHQVQVKSERHRETFHLGLESFIKEARLLARFDHPSLVRVYRSWEANGTAYLVMPFLEGTTLKDVLRAMGEPPDEAWLRALLGALTEALLVLHAEHCYHRDIAPDNVMRLVANNRWLLLDFGAARQVIGDLTQALTVILKPGYAPIEQYAEIPGMKQGPWTDVYALAAVVYFAIMRRTPPPSVGRLLNDTYVPLTQSAAGRYSESFLAAIDHALAVRPEQRTANIGALRQALGLGEATLDPYSTSPLPGGLPVPPRGGTAAAATGRGAPVSPLAPTEIQPAPGAARNAIGPPPAAVGAAASPVARAGDAAAASAASGTGKRPVTAVAAGVGLVVLAAAGFGVYRAMAPAVSDPAASPPVRPAIPAAALPAPAVATPAASTAPAAAVFDVSQAFERLVQAQSPGFAVRLQTQRSSYRIGKDELRFSVSADRDGYLYAFVHGADKTLTQLYPNDSSGPLRVLRGQPLSLPRGTKEYWQTTEPTGPEEVLVMVSALPRDLSALHPHKDGIVWVYPTGAEAAGLAGLAGQAGGAAPVLAGRVVCPATGACDESYGAALAKVEIVR